VATVLGLATPNAIDPHRPLQQLGLDSLIAVELRNRLSAVTGLRLPATLLFDHPTASALARLVRAKCLPDGVTPSVPALLTLLTELDRLEAAFAAASPDDIGSPSVAARLTQLQALFSKWLGARGKAAGPTIAETLEAADDEELFKFIDQKIG
jgi:acyl carrier protein